MKQESAWTPRVPRAAWRESPFLEGGEIVNADKLSILLQVMEPSHDEWRMYRVGFLVTDLARAFVYPGAELLITEGPKVVAEGTIKDVFDSG